MSIRSEELNPPPARRSVPHGTLRDLLLSMAFIVSGPALWCFSAAILADQPVQSDLGMRLGQLWNLHGMEAAEGLIGLLAAASGLLISIGAAVSVLAALSQQVARRCSAWRMEQLLSQFSPGFLRRGAALILGAGLTLTGVAADSWPRATTTEVMSTLEDQTASGPADDAADDADDPHPDSALFDTTGPGDAPGPEADTSETPPSAQDPEPVPDQDPDPRPKSERGASQGKGSGSDSGLLTPEEPNTDRLQGLPQRRGAEPEQVVVRLGDSLWDIAADHLGADATDWEIAASWPRWYEANRQRIGADPGIILPGTVLCVPSR